MSDAPRKVLVVQLRRLGDVLVTTPAVAALRAAWPKAQIDFLVEAPGDQLLTGNPNLDNVVLYDAKKHWSEIRKVRAMGYDCVIDFLGTPRSAVLTFFSGAAIKAGPSHVFHRWAYNRKFPQPLPGRFTGRRKLDFIEGAFGIPVPPRVKTLMTFPQASADEAAAFFKNAGVGSGERVLAVAPFSRRATRLWPKEHFARLLTDFTRTTGAKALIFWGGPGEGTEARWIRERAGPAVLLIPDTRDLKLCAALLKRCERIVACDNGFKHMANAVGVPALSLYGATDPANWNPPDDPNYAVMRRSELFCIGCEKNECPYKIECMTGLKPERVLEKLLSLEPVHA